MDEGQEEDYQLTKWMQKFVAAFGLMGSKTDSSNIVYAIMGRDGWTPSESDHWQFHGAQISKTIQDFKEILNAEDTSQLSQLWIPEVLILDGEIDDLLAWVEISAARRKLGLSDLKVFFQLPATLIKKEGKMDLAKFAEHLKTAGVTVFFDSHVYKKDTEDAKALNEKALHKLWCAEKNWHAAQTSKMREICTQTVEEEKGKNYEEEK